MWEVVRKATGILLLVLILCISMVSCDKEDTLDPETGKETEDKEQPGNGLFPGNGNPIVLPDDEFLSGEQPTDPGMVTLPTVPTEDPTVTVDPPVILPNPNACLTLDVTEKLLNLEEGFTLSATYIPKFEEDDRTLAFVSDDPTVATVSKDGTVTAVGVGETVIHCKNADGSMVSDCAVTVKLQWQNYSFAFKADLSEYEWAMNPESDAYVFLVNKDNPIGKNYVPDDLVKVRDTRKDGRDAQKLTKIAEAALHALYLEAEANGMLYVNKTYGQVLSVTSGYRDYWSQDRNFNNKVNSILNSHPDYTRQQAEAIAAQTINRPGTSEHQTGLCLDMHNLRTAERELAETFGESEAGKWLKENSYKFGYILRYEADKTDITGIAYESWHFRYVGRYHATRMYELDMCLEEYTEYLKEMGYDLNLEK